MGSAFNPKILIDKLEMLNSSQASIETLSHWCIFHMNKANYVVDTWERQFYSSPRERRLAFLYLANDIMQNSRKKGIEFVEEFWRVLPDALCDVVVSGDDFGRTAAYRLINIWEERKVFSSEQQNIREEFDRRLVDGGKRNGKFAGVKPKQKRLVASSLEKLVSCYQVVNGGQMDEEANLSKCRGTVDLLEKMEKDVVESNVGEGSFDEASILEDMRGQHVVLKNCIEQLAAVESARASLVSYLRDALQEQEFKLDRGRQQLQVCQARLEKTANICQNYSKLEKTANICQNYSNSGNELLLDRHDNSNDVRNSDAPATSRPVEKVEIEQSAPGMYTLQPPYRETSVQVNDESRKTDALRMATKLTTLTSSSQLSSVLTSLASEGVIGNIAKGSFNDYSPEKRQRLDNSHFTFQPVESTGDALQPPLPPTSAPPIPPPPPPGPLTMPMAPLPSSPSRMHHFPQDHSGMPAATFTCGIVGHHLPQPLPGGTAPFPMAPPNGCQSFPGSEGNHYGQPASVPTVLMPRQ